MTISEVLQKAQERAREMNLPYEGALLPEEAWFLLQQVQSAKLVDVRTRAELDWVGRIPGATEIEWLTYPGNQLNAHFLNQLQQQVDKESLVMFICRSGQRSHNSAMVATQSGYPDCYNVLEGFEGDKDAASHRNSRNGWRVKGLPWIQS
ncbi:MAG: rhodanese-like domain-containing protein [Betaproteobacteria bacterium]|nr:rhodanese-like domain-containing protein [Betaproteobacteria bacterium]